MLPRFSLRMLFIIIGVSAIGSLVLRSCWRDETWGYAIVFSLVAVGLTFLLQAVVFAVLWPLVAFMSRPNIASETVPVDRRPGESQSDQAVD